MSGHCPSCTQKEYIIAEGFGPQNIRKENFGGYLYFATFQLNMQNRINILDLFYLEWLRRTENYFGSEKDYESYRMKL